MVVPTIGILIRFFLASSTPLRIDSGTSPALPIPTPTWPAPSPTTTTALKLNRRPPLTTLATRLIWTTRSSSASLLGSIRATVAPSDQNSRPASRAASASDLIRPWYRNPARSKTTRSTPAALARSAISFPTTAASADLVSLEPFELLLDGRGRGERLPGRVVDDLRVDVVEAAEDRETRPRVGTRQVKADPFVALASGGAAGGDLRHRVRSFVGHGLLLPADLAGLAGLAADVLAGVAHALALVGLRLARRADLGGDLADQLLVDADDREAGRVLDLEADAFGRVDLDRVAVAEVERQLLAD